MPVSADDFIENGSIENSEEASEAQRRAGVHSLYYGVYHKLQALRAVLPEHSNGYSRSGSHEILTGYFVDFPLSGTAVTKDVAKQLRRLGIIADSLRCKRTVADYRLEETIRSVDYSVHKESAKRCIDLYKMISESKLSSSLD